MEEATAHLSELDRSRLPRLLDTVWEYAISELDDWMPPYLASSEVTKGRIGLAEFFVYGNPDCWKDAATQFISRIDLTRGHMERRTAAGKRAFIRLPSYWFDHRNKDGFRITQEWYLTNKHQLKKAAINEEISRCLKRYWRELERNEGDIDEAIRIIRQRLGKRGTGLFKLFTKRLQTALRCVGSAYVKPFSSYSEKRHKGVFERELKHCMDIKTRFDNNPKYGDVSWAAIYDVSAGYDRGPKIFEFWLDKGRWYQIIG